MPICNKCKCTFPNRMVVNGKIRNLQRRKYCLNCSPFGQHNTRKLVKQSKLSKQFEVTEKICPRCKILKGILHFYRRRNGTALSSYCKICTNLQVVERQRKFKQECITYKGGCCSHCGYDRYIGALEFHHLDPNEKDSGIAQVWSKGFTDVIRKELDKCILLCANCHREEHARLNGLLLIK